MYCTRGRVPSASRIGGTGPTLPKQIEMHKGKRTLGCVTLEGLVPVPSSGDVPLWAATIMHEGKRTLGFDLLGGLNHPDNFGKDPCWAWRDRRVRRGDLHKCPCSAWNEN